MFAAVPLSVPIRWRIRWLAPAIGVLYALASATPAVAADPALARVAAHQPSRQVNVIVQFRAGASAGSSSRAASSSGSPRRLRPAPPTPRSRAWPRTSRAARSA